MQTLNEMLAIPNGRMARDELEKKVGHLERVGGGYHIFAELLDVRQNISDAKEMESLIKNALRAGNLHSVMCNVMQFPPREDHVGGASVTHILEESHVTLHTWPEEKFAQFDIFTCGDNKEGTNNAFLYVVKILMPDYVVGYEIDRSIYKYLDKNTGNYKRAAFAEMVTIQESNLLLSMQGLLRE